MSRFTAVVAAAFALSACAGTPIWEATRPDRKVADIDGMSISVVQRDPDRYDATYFGVSVVHNMLDIKDSEIKAVEQISGCKVVMSEFMPGTTILNTRVNCPKR